MFHTKLTESNEPDLRLVIDRPGKTPLSVPLDELMGLRPGQSIDTDKEGYFWAKMESGSYKVFKDVTPDKTMIHAELPCGSKEFEIPAPSDDAQSESDSDSDSDLG